MQMLKISLAAARVNARLTQSEVAGKMGVGKQTLVNWENGKTEPKASQLMQLCEIYAIPQDFIFLQRE